MQRSGRKFYRWLPKTQKTYRQSALLVQVHGAVWTCIIKERNTRKYEYVIHLATIASSWNDIDIESKPKSKFPYYSTVCSKNHKTRISLNSSPIFNVKIALELC